MTVDPRTTIREKVAEALQREDHTAMVPRAQIERMADAAIAAHLEALEQANRIESVEELDALGLNSIVRTEDGDTWEKRTYLSGLWDCLTEDGNGGLRRPPLPCRALYRPRGA